MDILNPLSGVFLPCLEIPSNSSCAPFLLFPTSRTWIRYMIFKHSLDHTELLTFLLYFPSLCLIWPQDTNSLVVYNLLFNPFIEFFNFKTTFFHLEQYCQILFYIYVPLIILLTLFFLKCVCVRVCVHTYVSHNFNFWIFHIFLSLVSAGFLSWCRIPICVSWFSYFF